MDKKRLLRSPLVWIAVVLVVYLMYSYFADETRGYLPQSTSVALAQLKDGNVTQATIDEHQAIYQALRARDPFLAQSAALVHVNTSESWLRRILKG